MRAYNWKMVFDEWDIDQEGRSALHLLALRDDRGLAAAESIIQTLIDSRQRGERIDKPSKWVHKASTESRSRIAVVEQTNLPQKGWEILTF